MIKLCIIYSLVSDIQILSSLISDFCLFPSLFFIHFLLGELWGLSSLRTKRKKKPKPGKPKHQLSLSSFKVFLNETKKKKKKKKRKSSCLSYFSALCFFNLLSIVLRVLCIKILKLSREQHHKPPINAVVCDTGPYRILIPNKHQIKLR